MSFLVTVPDEPPDGASLLVAGNHRAFGGWKPDELRLKRLDDGHVQSVVSVPIGSVIEYKLTRGWWATVEKGAAGGDIANRRLRVVKDQVVNLTIARWG